MKKIFFPLLMIVAILTGSCSDEIDYTPTNECIITQFTLGQISRTMHTTTATGKDSTYTVNFAGSYYPLTIDQRNKKIYNVDSLPKGSHVNHILASIASVGQVAYRIAGDPNAEWKIYHSSDSIDFTYLLQFRVVANDGNAQKDYEVKINVHQQEENEFGWVEMPGCDLFRETKQMKALYWKNKLHVLGLENNNLVLYSQTHAENNSWQKAGTVGSQGGVPTSACIYNDHLYMNTIDGRMITSSDGVQWTQIPHPEHIKQLIAASDKKIYAVTAGGIKASADGGINWYSDSLDTDAGSLPEQDMAGIYYALPNGNHQMILLGNQSVQTAPNDSTALVWSKLFIKGGAEDQAWMFYPNRVNNPFACPQLQEKTLIRYDQNLLLFGKASLNGNKHAAYDACYTSKDNGITWKQDEVITMPQELTGSDQSVTATVDPDKYIWLISNNKIWKGRISHLAFK